MTYNHVLSIPSLFSLKSLPSISTSTSCRTQSVDTGLQELRHVFHKSRNEGSLFFFYLRTPNSYVCL